ncbi:Gfo/Idh/MocA family oxidoreductase [Pontibacter oryzae]|uniref:Uncharacterized protein n=1 Tax=Pontibacter oryzae TaxID=2304593 RepID=A0A399SI89_9BACT|nr:hypothetical protein [Pontibacter oryzae]RIJ42731.1 hypothetical protein D1627_02470 [Pontibacter oryzae]
MQETILSAELTSIHSAIRFQEAYPSLLSQGKPTLKQSQGLGKSSYRHTKAMQEVYKVLQSGELGPLYAIELISHKACNTSLEGRNCVIELGAPLLELGLWATGFPKILDAKGHLYANGERCSENTREANDYGLVLLELENDISLQLCCSWHLAPTHEPMLSATFYGINGGVAFKSIAGKPGQFMAERYAGPNTQTLYNPENDPTASLDQHYLDAIAASVSKEKENRLTEVLDKIFRK